VTDSATSTTAEAGDEDLGDLLLEVLPPDGSTIGNLSAREALSRVAERHWRCASLLQIKDYELLFLDGRIKQRTPTNNPTQGTTIKSAYHLLAPMSTNRLTTKEIEGGTCANAAISTKKDKTGAIMALSPASRTPRQIDRIKKMKKVTI